MPYELIKVSVIVPAYNAQDTIGRLVDSLLAQTLTSVELLLIDDGSTDDTPAILDEYARKDARIRVFHKENGGVAMARQLGVDNARGEYSIHADADDWVEPTMLEDMYAKAKAEDADVVIADFYSVKGKMSEKVVQRIPSFTPENALFAIFKGALFGALWNKMLRTSLYKRYDARFFPNINYCEDVLIWAQIMQHDEVRIAYLPQAYYYYVYQQNSITHKMSRAQYDNLLRYEEKLNEILPQPKYKEIRERVRLGLFQGGIFSQMLTTKEIYRQLWRNKFSIFKYNRSGNWFLCFALLLLGQKKITYKIVK